MNLSGILGLVFILIFLGLIIISAAAGRNRPDQNLRRIPAFNTLRRSIGLAVEAGSRLHFSIGRGRITGPESASAFVGLSVLGRLARSASAGDRPLIATTGEPSLAILAQDTLKSSYQDIGLIDQYEPTAGQLSGTTPFSYAAGAMPIVGDDKTAVSVMFGSFGPEVALLTEASERAGNMTLAGTDNITGQAVLYATAHEPLIGEELYAGGAYVNAGPMHIASLRAQDAVRWLLVVIIILGIIIKAFGFDQAVMDMLGGML